MWVGRLIKDTFLNKEVCCLRESAASAEVHPMQNTLKGYTSKVRGRESATGSTSASSPAKAEAADYQ